MRRLPTILVCFVAIFIAVMGMVDISMSRVEDLPFNSGFFEGIDRASNFDRPLEIMTDRNGLVLLAVACALLVLAFDLKRGAGSIWVAGILSIGTLVSTLFTMTRSDAPFQCGHYPGVD